MCFSATASFVGAGVIGATGVATLTLVKDKRQLPFAALPLLFAIHQALEGWTWLELGHDTDAQLSGWGVHLWVLFAWAILPIFIPWSVWLMEPDRRRRTWLIAPMVVGAITFAYMVYLSVQPEVSVEVIDSNLDYHLGTPFSAAYMAVPYVFATCFAPMMSSFRWVIALGVGNLIGMSVAAALKAADYSSIWCTIAAFLSLIVFGHYLSQYTGKAAGKPVGHGPATASA
ncbi:hypothetical protein MYK68_09630 [Gordonia sp. PP30]|uniref:DUF6629 family protein n=1 Tax=Gordonia sp. PP30 TaxID=2935861 RepID=UPI001FFE8B95|nr:DUF6629 family protein [Gordonia sp. PP30]UQE76788.1 hypothetical protein MYK68_09630 [Gordonia sp. PP30]